MGNRVYVFGHRNPDTDAVTSAISLAYLKRKLGLNAVPAVLSSVNLETRYALNYFKVKEPLFLNDVKVKIKHLNYTRNYSVVESESIDDAYHKMMEASISKIPVVDDNRKLLGIVTMKDIAREQFNDNIDRVDSTYDNILKAIDGCELLRFDDVIKGNLIVAAYRSTTILDTVKLDSNTIMMVGDRHSVIEYAVNSGVKLLIVTGNHQIKSEHLEIALRNKVNIIVTSFSTLIASRKINLANNIGTVDYKRDALFVRENDFVSDFVKLSNKMGYSYYPVVNGRDICTGILRVSDVNYNNRMDVILVDHNTYDQSAVGIEETNILEIIDHHNIGNIGTRMPINFRNMPVGSSNTIIYILYKENNIDIPSDIAGLMLSGILSDTLILNSPTTTDFDREAVSRLAVLANVDYQEYGFNMLKAGSSLKGKTREEVLFTDYKTYPVLETKIGLGQVLTTNPDEILRDMNSYIELLNKVSNTNDYYLVCLFVTDIIKGGSYVLYSDRAYDILKRAFKNESLEQGSFLEGVVSRKKQILPVIMFEMGEE